MKCCLRSVLTCLLATDVRVDQKKIHSTTDTIYLQLLWWISGSTCILVCLWKCQR